MTNPPTVLVVEDDELVRAVLVEFLADSGLTVVETSRADDGIKELQQSPIDLVFSDIKTPGRTDGFGLAEWARVNRPNIPVILTSGYSSRAKLYTGFGEIVAKPYALGMVLERIRRRLRAKRPVEC